MSINNYVTMACDCCGKALKIDDQNYWETDDCARAEAEDEGWSCFNGGSNDQEFCPNCVAVKLVSLITMWPCEHNWVDADNEVVRGAEICTKCLELRPKR